MVKIWGKLSLAVEQWKQTETDHAMRGGVGRLCSWRERLISSARELGDCVYSCFFPLPLFIDNRNFDYLEWLNWVTVDNTRPTGEDKIKENVRHLNCRCFSGSPKRIGDQSDFMLWSIPVADKRRFQRAKTDLRISRQTQWFSGSTKIC